MAATKKTTKQPPKEEKNPLSDQLDKAMRTVENNQRTALTLHFQWRTHLLRMAYVVTIISFHQAQAPTTSCIKEIKHWNELKKNHMEDGMSGFQALWAVVNDSFVEIMAIACAGCLVWCLSLPMRDTDFSTLPYRLSCACVPMIVSLYFANKTIGCLKDDPMMQHTIEDPPERTARGFPVILIFHTIVSISLWFMHFQIQQHFKNIEMVQKMKKDLKDARESKKKN